MKASRWVLVMTMTLVATLGGTALAFWTAKGQGVGAVSTGTTTSITLTPGTPAALLVPGGVTDVVLVASNPDSSPVTITSFSLDVSQGVAGYGVDGDHNTCDTSSLQFSPQTSSGWTVPGRSGAVDGSLPITLASALTMSADAANACQGATFTIYLKAA